LITLEEDRIPCRVSEPACGIGSIVFRPRATGCFVLASDVFDHGAVPSDGTFDYLATPMLQVEVIITNPPSRLAQRFLEKALGEVPYVALSGPHPIRHPLEK
jgi:hypothetical protein